MQDMFFEFSDSRSREADGYLTVVNHGCVTSKSFISCFLLIGPGMLVVPLSLPALLWQLIAVFWTFSS